MMTRPFEGTHPLITYTKKNDENRNSSEADAVINHA